MSYILLQNPHSPLAGKLDALVSWNGIYYEPEPHLEQYVRHMTVFMWDCHEFAQQIQDQWLSMFNPACMVIALLQPDFNSAILDNCGHLFMALPTTTPPAFLRKNLQLAEESLQNQVRQNEKLILAQRQMEEMGLIGQAKKWLMEQWKLSEEQAHRWLQRQSQAKQQKLINTARQIMQGYYLGRPLPENKPGISDKPSK